MQALTPHATPESQARQASQSPLHLLVETGRMLANERNVDTIVQSALDAGGELCHAQWGVFFYTDAAAEGAPCPLFKLTGSAVTDPAHFPLASVDHRLIETLFGNGTLRCADISADSRFGPGSPFASLTQGPEPTRSYFAIPVHSATGERLGGLLYGDTRVNVFSAECEPNLETLAAHAAVAIENARLREKNDRLAAEVELARASQLETSVRLSQVLDATTNAIILVDREWRFVSINPRARQLLGKGDEVLGLPVREVFPNASTAFGQRYRDAMEGRGSGEFVEYAEVLGLWLSIRVYPAPQGIAIFFEDVSEERRRLHEKDETDRRLRQALDAARLGTWMWDRATDFLDLDERAAELYQAEPHTPITRSALRERLVVGEDQGLTTASLHHAVETGGLYHAEYRAVGPDGTTTWLSASGIPTFAPQSTEVVGMVGTVQDITLRKTQEEALRQSEKLAATGRLAATIAHEINNPLEAVTNLIYLVKTDPTVPSLAQNLLETADQELARVAQIAQQTLGFYRDTTRPVQIDLGDLLKSVVALFHRKLHYKKIDYTLDLEPALNIYGLQGELRQVFSNLVVNAIDASLHGRITICARHRTHNGVKGVSVLVCDEGSGIPRPIRQRLFSPFFTTKVEIGTGLGLWVTRGIVEKQGGTIRFRSKDTQPSGTIFRVFLRDTMQISELITPAPKFLQ